MDDVIEQCKCGRCGELYSSMQFCCPKCGCNYDVMQANPKMDLISELQARLKTYDDIRAAHELALEHIVKQQQEIERLTGILKRVTEQIVKAQGYYQGYQDDLLEDTLNSAAEIAKQGLPK